MIHLLRRIGEPYRSMLIAALTFGALLAADRWPGFKFAIWAAFVVLVALLLLPDVEDLRKPVNYDDIRISGGTIEYVAFGRTHVIRLAEVSKLEFVREEAVFPDLYGPYIESKWVVWAGGPPSIEVMDEWPHRKLLLEAFRVHLPGFDDVAAKAGLGASGEGRWLCYEVPVASA